MTPKLLKELVRLNRHDIYLEFDEDLGKPYLMVYRGDPDKDETKVRHINLVFSGNNRYGEADV